MSTSSFVQILADALLKKEHLLEEILKICREQEECLKKDQPDLTEYSAASGRKAELSKQIEKIDEGFLSVYERVKDELESNPAQYADEIRRMKKLVTEITEKTNSIGVAEQRLNEAFKKKAGNLGNIVPGNSAAGASLSGTNSAGVNDAGVSAKYNMAAQKYAQTVNGTVNGRKPADATFINKKQ